MNVSSGVVVDQAVRLMNVRCDYLAQRVTQRRNSGRVPRVCLYALTVGQQQPCRSLDESKGFAVEQGWHVGRRAFTDHFGATDPQTRPGWGLVRQQIRAGFADGVVVLTQSVISPHLDEFERQLSWFETHLGFIALVTPERSSRATAGLRAAEMRTRRSFRSI
ncbi:hypothetical protein [Streptomyces sp. NPDC058374]|uniref:hypothetical protein n=1 Tax=Streptomyces sp. NPDC058374 TaxID=3346466 RepID=UPI003648ABBA